MLAVLGAAAAILAAASPGAPLSKETLLVPLPSGFKVGWTQSTARLQVMEFVPNGETVENWTRMVTQQISYGVANADPDALPKVMSTGWVRDCAGGSARKVTAAVESNYPVSIWMFVCPLNPATNKPETMWMKVISGNDSLYNVQYAYRSAGGVEMLQPAMAFLKSVTVCDGRKPDRPCPIKP